MNARDDMSDAEVLSAVRDTLSAMPLAGPPDVEAVMARGRARRRRRLIPGVTGTLAVAAGAALAVTALAPAAPPASRQTSHQAGRQPAVGLAAWTVTRLADGDISLTIRELKDPAGLQSTLRADGVPANVTFRDQQSPACRPYPGGTIPWPPQPPTPLLRQVFPKPYGDLSPPPHHSRGWSQAPRRGGPPTLTSPPPDRTVVVIAPSALPSNAGVQVAATYGARWIGPVQVVYTSPQCTGS
jgi:hypothetical protein